MGAWGVKLYQNDIAEDVKCQYMDYLKEGKSNEEATQELITIFEELINDIDDGPNFWFVLADQQWQLGRLLPYVKDQALKWIEKGADLSIWYESSKKLGDERKKVLEELSVRLNSPQLPEKKIYKRRYYTCPWKIGDTFAYKMESELAKEHGLYGRYIIFQKAGNSLKIMSDYSYEGHICPIVRCWISNKARFSTDMADRTECIRRSKNCRIDGYYSYAYEIVTTSKRLIPKKLIYLGNFELYVPKDDSNDVEKSYFSLLWHNFEDFIIKKYLVCNLNKYNSLSDFIK